MNQLAGVEAERCSAEAAVPAVEAATPVRRRIESDSDPKPLKAATERMAATAEASVVVDECTLCGVFGAATWASMTIEDFDGRRRVGSLPPDSYELHRFRRRQLVQTEHRWRWRTRCLLLLFARGMSKEDTKHEPWGTVYHPHQGQVGAHSFCYSPGCWNSLPNL